MIRKKKESTKNSWMLSLWCGIVGVERSVLHFIYLFIFLRVCLEEYFRLMHNFCLFDSLITDVMGFDLMLVLLIFIFLFVDFLLGVVGCAVF